MQIISEDGNPQGFTFGWCNQKPQKVNYIFGDLIHDLNWFSEAWNEHWSCFCVNDVQVPQNDGHTLSFDCWIDCCYLSHGIFHFICNFINLTILSLLYSLNHIFMQKQKIETETIKNSRKFDIVLNSSKSNWNKVN